MAEKKKLAEGPKATAKAQTPDFFADMGAALRSVGANANLAEMVLTICQHRFGGDHGLMLEYEATTGGLIQAASFGKVEEMLSQDMRIFAQFATDHPLDTESVVIAPVANDIQKLSARKSVRRDMTCEVILFPLTASGNTVAVVYLGSKTKGALSFKDVTPEGLIELGKTLGEFFGIDKNIRQLARQNDALHKQVKTEATFDQLIGTSEQITRVKRAVELVVGTDIPVALIGEKGTGIPLIAEILHDESPRKRRPFVIFSASAVSAEMLPAILFGEAPGPESTLLKGRKGALREARGGTLFLEDIEVLPLNVQEKLMEAMSKGVTSPLHGEEEYPVDFRLIASTTRNLKALYDEKKLRHELYLKLNLFPILVPPLRDRLEDLPHLVQYYAEEASANFGKSISGVSAEVYDYIGQYDFPGNLDELEMEVRQAVLRTPSKQGYLSVSSLSSHLISKRLPEYSDPGEGTLKQRVARIEKRLIIEALERNNHNQSITADQMGLSRQALINKLHRYGIETGRIYKRRMREIVARAEANE